MAVHAHSVESFNKLDVDTASVQRAEIIDIISKHGALSCRDTYNLSTLELPTVRFQINRLIAEGVLEIARTAKDVTTGRKVYIVKLKDAK